MRTQRPIVSRTITRVLALTYLAAVAFTHGIEWFIWYRVGHVDPAIHAVLHPMHQMGAAVLCVAAIIHALERVAFHPATNNAYWRWLAATPWQASTPLPLGPVGPRWQDGLLMLVMCVLAALVNYTHPALPALFMLAAYVCWALYPLARIRQFGAILAVITLFPLTWYVVPNWWACLAIVAIMFGCVQIGFNLAWTQFPWGIYDADNAPSVCPKAGELGWPFDRINAYVPGEPIELSAVMITSFLAGWYVFSMMHCIDEPLMKDTAMMAPFIVPMCGAAAFIRFLAYAANRFPPITFIGRLVRGPIIIKGYDRIVVAPLVILATSVIGPYAMAFANVYAPLSAAIMTTLTLSLAFGLPPTKRNFELTGHYRLNVPSRARNTG